MNQNLILADDIKFLANVEEKYKPLVENINKYLPQMGKDMTSFNKAQSSFMDTRMVLSHPTPIRQIRQGLAEIQSAKSALEDSNFGVRKKEIELKIKERDALLEDDKLKKELIEIEIQEIQNSLFNIQEAQKGAIRRLSGYVEQIENIRESYNIGDFSEADFEAEEEKYHIMKVFEQAIHAARSHGGFIDEGNHIYFYQIGINGAVAQKFITEFLMLEQSTISNDKLPDGNFMKDFLKKMSEVFEGCSQAELKYKGMKESNLSILK